MVQWLGLCAFIAEGTGSTPGQGTNIPQAVQHGQKKKKEILCCFKASQCSMPELLLKQIQVFCVEFLNVFIDLIKTEASIILS